MATDAQLQALREIARGSVTWFAPGVQRARFMVRGRSRADVVQRLVNRGWARVGPRRSRLSHSSVVLLTDEGRVILGSHDGD